MAFNLVLRPYDFDYEMSQSSLFTSRLSLKGKESRPGVFSGTAATFHSEFQSFCSEVDIDHLRDFMLLAVHAELCVIDDGKGVDAIKPRVLDPIGQMCLKGEALVQIKQEPRSFLSKTSLFRNEHDEE